MANSTANKSVAPNERDSQSKLTAVMITVDRGRTNYIEASITSLIDGGFFDYPGMTLEVFDSGSANTDYLNFIDDLPYPITINYSPERIELIENFARALKTKPAFDAETIIFMEDDIEVAPNLPHRIDQFIHKHLEGNRVWSFYASYQDIVDAVNAGEEHYDLPYPNFYGSLCFAISAADTYSLAAWLSNYYNTGGNRHTADLQINEWLKHEMKIDHVCCSAPSLVQHIGIRSSFSEHAFIQNTSYSLNFELEGGRIPVLSSGVEASDDDDNFTLCLPTTNASVSLNKTAKLILSRCNGVSTTEQIIQSLSQKFDQPIHRMREDVKITLIEIEKIGFLTWLN
ncbi:MAG: PqqD family protein [Proteobacteria bacterium]|jgi:hypothetical protein|nr:PqqD family protein [Pseudomonadota bacterium]